MQTLKKMHRFIYPILMVLFLVLLDKTASLNPSWLKFPIAIGLAYFLSPRKRVIHTENGEKTQLVWVFLKEPITL